jgi:GNAT superfamily N-acetyltransferase
MDRENTMTQVEIRKARPGDIEKLLPVYDEFLEYHKQFGESYDKVHHAGQILQSYHTTQLDNEKAYIAVAVTRGDAPSGDDSGGGADAVEDVVGFCIGSLQEKPPVYAEKHVGEIGSIAVKQGYQRQGIGERLLRQVFAWFKEHHIRRIETAFALGNMKSMNFWIKMGFDPFLQNIFKNI